MKNINKKSKTISYQITDFEGNKTLWSGLNNLDSIDNLILFLEARKNHLIEEERAK